MQHEFKNGQCVHCYCAERSETLLQSGLPCREPAAVYCAQHPGLHGHRADCLSPKVADPDVDGLAGRVLDVCKRRGWSLHWTSRGAYLHLEASELIEALRGKRGEVLDEAGDVLFVLMSITENEHIPWDRVVASASRKCEMLMTAPPYVGEERSAKEHNG